MSLLGPGIGLLVNGKVYLATVTLREWIYECLENFTTKCAQAELEPQAPQAEFIGVTKNRVRSDRQV